MKSKRIIAMFVSAVLMLSNLTLAGCSKDDGMNNLIKDSSFQNGFMLMRKGVSIGYMPTFDKEGSRTWYLHQNNSRFVMTGKTEPTVSNSDEIIYENEGKKVRVYKDETGSWVLNFALFCDNEYETVRTKSSDPWVHLMFEQLFEKSLSAADYSKLTLDLSVRDDLFINHMTPEEYNANIMCAQTNIYFIVRNTNQSSEDYEKFIWLGLQMFDNRVDIPGGTYMVDSGFEGATDTLIYGPNMNKYVTGTMKDGKWHDIHVDMLELLDEALSKAQSKGYFTHTSIEDISIQNFYISTEVSGNFTHEMSFKNIKFDGVTK